MQTEITSAPTNPKLVIIIGNGFDLALGLKTGYTDFLGSRFYESVQKGQNLSGEIVVPDDTNKMIWGEQNLLVQFISNHQKKENWIDLEQCIYEYCYQNPAHLNNTAIDKEIYAIRFYLDRFIAAQERAYSIQESSRATYTLSYHFMHHLSQLSENWQIWNFNYTSSCEDLMARCTNTELTPRDERIRHIHGYTNDYFNENNLRTILGTRYDRKVMNVCPSAIKSQIIPDYKNQKTLLDTHLQNAESVIFFGFAMGKNDYQYFNNLFNSSNLKRIGIITLNTYSDNKVRSNMNEATDGKMGEGMENGRFDVSSFYSENYYDELVPYYIAENPKRNEAFNLFMDNFKNKVV